MKLEKASITIIFSGDKTIIEIKDHTSTTTFARITLTPEQLSLALSRLMHTPCEAEVFGLDKLGKRHENEAYAFPIPKDLMYSSKTKELNEICNSFLSQDTTRVGFAPDEYYGSQNSFFIDEGKHYAKVTIRRWI